MEEPTETAVIVAVPEAESAVGQHRAQLDRSAAWGVPAHITVLYPFARPGEVTAAMLDALARAVATVPRFSASLESCDWFGEEVLWLGPDPEQRFRDLTGAVASAFPEYPPYGGRFDDVVPHLTVGDDGSTARLRDAESRVTKHLPLRFEVRSAQLWSGTAEPGAWRQIADLPLGESR